MRWNAIIFFMLAAGCAMGQNLYNNSAVISIGTSGVVYVKDTIFNNGTIINNGDMQVGGSWINNAQYDAGQGQITFNSNLPQIINHNDQSVSKLTVSGGGQKFFLADITVEDALNLTDGTLISMNDARIIINAGAQVVGGSDNAHIVGPVYHRGTGNKLFPLGNGTLYLPVELLNVQGSSAEIGLRSVELQNTTLSVSPSLNAISANRYWEVDLVAGSLANSVVVLPVREETVVTNADAVVVAQSESLDAGFESLGRSDFQGVSSNGKVTSGKPVTLPFLAVGIASTDAGIIVYNAVSANGDGSNDFLVIGNIENYPENTFTLFNRWGDKVFEMTDYDNRERVFRGKANINGERELVNGTYYYVLETKKDALKVNGFLTVKH